MNTAHERAFAVRRRYGIAVQDVPWRTYGVLAQLVFFALTCAGVFALYWFLPGAKGLITAVIAIALAEYLIRARHWFFTGIESGLWIGGLFAVIFDLPGEGKPEALLLFAAASAIAGARVRNPLFGALAAGFTMHYLETRYDLGVLFALVCGLLAIIALCRTWQRPSTEWLWIAIATLLPLAGYAEADAKWRTVTIALYAAYGALALILAIRKRHHAFFAAAGIGFAVAAIELARILALRDEAKFAIAGTLLLAISLTISRALRNRTTGFVSTKDTTADANLLELAATIAATPHHSPAATESRPEGDGNFGGAGASGSF